MSKVLKNFDDVQLYEKTKSYRKWYAFLCLINVLQVFGALLIEMNLHSCMGLFDAMVVTALTVYIVGTMVYVVLYPMYYVSKKGNYSEYSVYCNFFRQAFFWQFAMFLASHVVFWIWGANGIFPSMVFLCYAYWRTYGDSAPKKANDILVFLGNNEYISNSGSDTATFIRVKRSFGNPLKNEVLKEKIDKIVEIFHSTNYNYLVVLLAARIVGGIVF